MTTNKDKPVLTSAPPPLHSVAVIGSLTAFFLYLLPSTESLDQVATVKTFTNRIFPHQCGLLQLAYVRFVFAAIIGYTSFYVSCISPGVQVKTPYLPQSKLIQAPINLVGIKALFPFTCWSWNFLGAYFTLSGYIAWKVATADESVEISPILLRTTLLLWEIAAPFTLSVAAVVKYAIWPAALKGGDTTPLKTWRALFMHNLNVAMALTEVALLGGLPVRWSEVSLGPLVGSAYVIFSWNMSGHWTTPKVGPQFIYFFFDTTLPGYTPSIAILVLLAVLMTFYGVFVSAESLLTWIDGGLVTHCLFVVVLCWLVMRLWD